MKFPQRLRRLLTQMSIGSCAVLASCVLSHSVQAGITVTPNPGFVIEWNGNDGANFGGAVPDNLALASNGATAFSSSDLGPQLGIPFHVAANANDGLYGNGNSWIGGDANPFPEPFLGIALPGSANVASVAWGRSNTGDFGDRADGLFTLQFTGDATVDGNSNWTSIGTVEYTGNEDPAPGGGFTSPLRHEFRVGLFNDAPIPMTGFRLVVPATGIAGGSAIDEIELSSTAPPPPPPPPVPDLDLVEVGGTFAPNNLAAVSAGAVAFTNGDLGTDLGLPFHVAANVNDETYGNGNSWIGNSPTPFAVVRFDGPQTVASVAWGRDNQGAFTDRDSGLYTLQYTTVVDPDASTPDIDWTTIGDITQFDGPDSFLRHRYDIDPVNGVTGLRLQTPIGAAIDEFEAYSTSFTPPGPTPVDQVIVVDELTAFGLAQIPNLGSPIPEEPAPGDGQYRWSPTPGDIIFEPFMEGTEVKVEMSWGVSFNHTQNFSVYFDPDGDGPEPEVLLIGGLRQDMDATQTVQHIEGETVFWSDYLMLGVLDLNGDSRFRVHGEAEGLAPQALTSSVWRFTPIPEPTSLITLVGMVGLIGMRRKVKA